MVLLEGERFYGFEHFGFEGVVREAARFASRVWHESHHHISGRLMRVVERVAGPIPGDINQDGQVTAADVGLLRAYLAGFPVDICYYSADVNRDGLVTAADVGLLRAYLAGFPVALGAK